MDRPLAFRFGSKSSPNVVILFGAEEIEGRGKDINALFVPFRGCLVSSVEKSPNNAKTAVKPAGSLVFSSQQLTEPVFFFFFVYVFFRIIIIICIFMSVSQGPVIPHSPQKQVTANTTPNFSANHASPFRQRPIKRSGGPSQTVHGHLPSQPCPPPPPPYPPFEMSRNNYPKMVPQVIDSPTREPPYRNNTWETRPIGGFVPQPRGLSDHPLSRNSRRGNFGPHPRGDGPHHNNYGGRRDHDRGNYEWHSRNSNVRDIHMQPQRAHPRGFIRAPPQPTSPRFMAPQPMRPYMNPAGYAGEVIFLMELDILSVSIWN